MAAAPSPVDSRPAADRMASLVTGAVRVLPAIWIGGSSLLLVVSFVGLHGAGRLKRFSRPLAAGDLAAQCSSLAGSLRIARRVSVAVCDRLAGPVLVGIVRPVILLPPAALTGWTPAQIEMVLLHELAHIRRWDNLVNLAQRLIESLLFFQPAVWWISGWMRLERELCCDDVVVQRTGRRRAYAETLLMVSSGGGCVPPLAAAAGSVPAASSSMARNHLVPRIRRLLQKGPEPMPISRTASLIIMVCFAAAIVVPLELDRRATQADEPRPAAQDAAVPRESAEDDSPAADEPTNSASTDPAVPRNETPREPSAGTRSDRGRGDQRRDSAADEAEPREQRADVDWPISVQRAVLKPSESLTIAAQQDGVLESVTVREGDRVRKGESLATFPDDRLRVAHIEVEVASKNLEGAEYKYARYKELDRAITSHQFASAKLEFERAALEVERARAEYELLEGALEILAPIDGIVGRVYSHAGESVKAGEPFVELVNTEQMRVEAWLDLQHAWSVRPGARVEVRARDIADVDLPVEREVFTGQLTFVDPAVHPVSGQVEVRALVQNRDGLLKAGLPVEMSIRQPPDDGPAPANPAAPEGVPDPPADEGQAAVDRWIRDLASDDSAVRQRATRELERAGEQALPALARATSDASAEVRRRADRLFFLLLEDAGPEAADRGLKVAIRSRHPATAQRASTELTRREALVFRGVWEIVSATRDGKADRERTGRKLVFLATDVLSLEPDDVWGDPLAPAAFRIDPTAEPPRFTCGGMAGVYVWDGDALTIKAVATPQADQPQPAAGSATYTFMLKCLRRPLDVEPQLSAGQQEALAHLKAHRAEIHSSLQPAGLAGLSELDLAGDDRKITSMHRLLARLHREYGQPVGFRMNRVSELDAALPHLLAFPRLKELRFSSTSLSDQHVREIARLQELERLDLSVAGVTDAGLAHLRGLDRLRELVLRETEITDRGLEYVGSLEQLETLDLLGTDITDAGLVHLENLPALRELNLCRTGVTDAGLDRLKRLTSLRALDLSATRVSDGRVDDLQGALADCRIVR